MFILVSSPQLDVCASSLVVPDPLTQKGAGKCFVGKGSGATRLKVYSAVARQYSSCVIWHIR